MTNEEEFGHEFRLTPVWSFFIFDFSFLIFCFLICSSLPPLSAAPVHLTLSRKKAYVDCGR